MGTFRGGVHVYEGKSLSKSKPIETLLPKGDLVFPLSQHIGAPAKPIVEVGDSVICGQMIAEAGGFVSSPVYSSVSGTVKAIEKRLLTMGDKGDCIVIENDGNYTEAEFTPCEDYLHLPAQEIIKKVSDFGIVGMGGAGFPTHVKLSPKEPDKIDHIIINCAECEPFITCDHRSILETPEKVVEGLRIMLSIFPTAKGVFAVEDNKPECIDKLRGLTAEDDRIEVCPLRTKYPQGGERQLIKAVTGRELNVKLLPADKGCIVDNVATVIAIYDAVALGRPLMSRVCTVSGDAVANPQNFRILLGTNLQEILDAAGGFGKEPVKMIGGGPMMGIPLFTLDIPAVKTTSALTFLTEEYSREYEATSCIGCGRCGEVCPEKLCPSKLHDFAEHAQYDKYEKWHGLECIECGCCSYICPARRHLCQAIKTAKKIVLANKRKG